MKIGLPLSFSLESFASQSACLTVEKIEKVFDDVVSTGGFKKEHFKALSSYTHDLLGVHIKLQTVKGSSAGVLLPITFNSGVSKHQETPSDQVRDKLLNIIEKEAPYNSGAIAGDFEYDPKERKFKGTATEKMSFSIFIGEDLPNKLTGREITGFFLHELGHIWFQLRSSLIFVERSVLLQESINRLSGAGPELVNMRSYLLKNLDKEQYRELWTKLDKNKASRADYMIASVLVKPQENYTGSLFGTGTQRDEQAADYYSSSFGYADSILSGLSTLGLKPDGMSNSGNVSFALGLGVFSWFFPLSIPFTAVGLWCLSSMELLGECVDSYDTDPLRFRRLLINARGVLKNYQNLDPAFVKEQLVTIDRIEKSIADQKDVIAIWGYLNPFYIRGRWAKRYEENLEHLLNNPLFASALKFKLDV